MSDCPWSRIDIIGQNGNDGLHYSEMGMNINLINQYWKLNKTEPKWATEESSAVTVAMCQRFLEELSNPEREESK
jgi:hypothetical protein